MLAGSWVVALSHPIRRAMLTSSPNTAALGSSLDRLPIASYSGEASAPEPLEFELQLLHRAGGAPRFSPLTEDSSVQLGDELQLRTTVTPGQG